MKGEGAFPPQLTLRLRSWGIHAQYFDEIHINAFRGCKELESVQIPDNVRYIGSGAFCSCTKLKNIRLPKNIKYMEHGVLSSCPALESLDIPDSVEHLGKYFIKGTSIKRIYLPSSLKIIEEGAFDDTAKGLVVYYNEQQNGIVAKAKRVYSDIKFILVPYSLPIFA